MSLHVCHPLSLCLVISCFIFEVLSYLTLSPLVCVFLPPVITLMCCNCVLLTFPLCISVHVLCFRHLSCTLSLCFLDLAYIFFFNLISSTLFWTCFACWTYSCYLTLAREKQVGFHPLNLCTEPICLQCLHMGPKPLFPHASGTSPGSLSSELDFDLFVCV